MSDFTPLIAEHVAKIAATLLGEETTLANRFNKTLAADFTGGRGSSISVAVPSSTKAESRALYATSDYHPQSLEESSIQVALTDEKASQIVLGLHEASLNLNDYTRQVLLPQARAVGVAVNEVVAGILGSVPVSTIELDPTKPGVALIQARRQLRANGVPATTPLHVLAGTNVYATFAEAALDLNRGTVDGLTVEESTEVGADELFVYIQDSIAVCLVAPRPVQGATNAASVQAGQAAATYIQGFDPRSGNSLSTVSVLVGVQEMPLARTVDGETVLVAHGGIVRIQA